MLPVSAINSPKSEIQSITHSKIVIKFINPSTPDNLTTQEINVNDSYLFTDSYFPGSQSIIDPAPRGTLILPGFINCWSYSWQSLFRNIPCMQNAGEYWLYNLAKRVMKMHVSDFYIAAKTHYLECLLSGATTVVDCFYLVRDKDIFACAAQAAAEVGIRLILVRGSIDSNPSGNKYLNSFVQKKEKILQESEEFITRYHDPFKDRTFRAALGPCSITLGSAELYTETKRLADSNPGIRSYTLLGEALSDRALVLEKGMTLTHYMSLLGWEGPDIIFVNPVLLNNKEIDHIAKSQTRIVDCPKSNARGTGISKISRFLQDNITVGIGTAGSAGNDRASILDEMLWMRYTQGIRGSKQYLDPSRTLRMGSADAAGIVGLPELGSLQIGRPADIIEYKIDDQIHFAGAVADPIGSLIGSGHVNVHNAMIDGDYKIRSGKHVSIDISQLIYEHNLISQRIEKEIR